MVSKYGRQATDNVKFLFRDGIWYAIFNLMVEMHVHEDLAYGEIKPGMIEAGVSALTEARRRGLSERDLVLAIYERMSAAGDPGSSERIRSFGLETIYNIRGVIEDLRQCERRASEHLAELLGDDA